MSSSRSAVVVSPARGRSTVPVVTPSSGTSGARTTARLVETPGPKRLFSLNIDWHGSGGAATGGTGIGSDFGAGDLLHPLDVMVGGIDSEDHGDDIRRIRGESNSSHDRGEAQAHLVSGGPMPWTHEFWSGFLERA